LVTPPEERISMEDIEEANNDDDLFDEKGNLIMGNQKKPSEAQEYTNEDGTRAVQCPKCSSEVTYKRLVKGIKKCPVCNHSIKVIKS
jgi:DNA-directed RNA polymerase subunit RPC12/RpoP